MENPNFLKNKYNLHTAPEVDAASRRTEKRTGEKLPQNPEERIQNYLERFKEIINRQDPHKRERGMTALKEILYDSFVIKSEEIPESYFEIQKRLAREQGHGEVEIDAATRKQLTEVIITDQKSSMDVWTDYFASSDATYPDWLKYYAFRSILGMGEYDKEKKQFTKRSNGTVKPFPDLNREALAYVLDAIEKKYHKENVDVQTQDPEEKKQFQKLLQGENFAKLYAFAIDKVTPASQEQLEKTQGQWIKYEQNSDHRLLVESLQGHGTGWCTAGESTAKAQLQNGDFYVFYSQDENGTARIPRAAIRMENDKIAEVRGVAEQQNLDSHITEVVQEKLQEFPDGQAYEKKNSDMKFLTEIEKKTQANQSLSKEELIFLYEIDSSIEGFGYQRDPRIKEIRDQRNLKEDAPIVFECDPAEIAWKKEDINEKTKAYIGELFLGIFQKNIEHIYSSFPEGKIQKYNIEIGGKTKEQLKQEMRAKNIYISDYADDLLGKIEITKNTERNDLVRLTVKDLGFPNGATTDEIYEKAEQLGLELCPAEVGPHLRLQYPRKEWMLIAMKQIADRNDDPDVFSLDTYDEQLALGGSRARPSLGWSAGAKCVFRFRKLEA